MSRVPALGSRGEGWVALQLGAIALIAAGDRFGPAVTIADAALDALIVQVGWIFLWVGDVFFLLGLAVLLRAGSLTAFPRPTANARLVESGPYRVVRHPIYAGLIAAAIGLGLARLSPGTLVGAAFLFVILDFKRRREEEWLVERHPGYAAYRARVRALIPWVY